ncbi:PP2C family protein-serine/threonine phosphatase [Terrabacter sp. 2YAF2]|uniref:PP2C family protein-serine/threonine phosphatase n=1 Tax=Terrabacter sp. 2YAF2 TaxID=3233026 RepID=UPI003F94D635
MNVPWQSPGASRAAVSPRLAALARIAAEVAAATTVEQLTDTITEEAAKVMGASRAALAVREGSDRLRTIAAHGLTPSEVQRWATLELAERSPLTDAVLTSQVVTITSRAELLERYPGLGDRTEGSSVTLPLISRTDGSVVGALGFRFDGRVGGVDPDELWVLGVLSDVCAQTMLRLKAEAQSAARAARLEFLADASQALASSLDYRQTLRQVASLAVPTHADWCSVSMVDDGVLRTLAVAHVDPEKVQLARELETRWPPDPDRPGGAALVARTGESLLVEAVTDAMLVAAAQDEEHLRVARELGLQSAMSVPLIAKDRVLGVLSFVAAESGRHYGAEDVAFAEDLARRAGLAIDNADLYSQTRRVASVLQSTLLPQDLPELAGWQLGTVYRQAGRTDVGGDYYDVSGLDDGRVIAVLGDVMGRGVDAAVSGSLMRSAARVLSTQDPEPAALARAMDRFMVVEPPTQMASAVYVLFDPSEDDIALVVAGHPPPLIFRDGRSRFVTEEGSPIHGLGEVPRVSAHCPFGAGDLLLLYTDGLVERRGESIDIGLRRLQAAADELFTAVDDLTDLDDVLAKLTESVSDPDRQDDVAVLAFRRVM